MRFRRGLFLSVFSLCSLRMLYNWQSTLASTTTSSASELYQLCQVHIVCRHGARTPIHLTPGIEEVAYNRSELLGDLEHTNVEIVLKEERGKYLEHPGETEKNYMKKVFKGGSEAGQLTKVGQQQAYELGNTLRAKYVEGNKFLGPKYSPDDVYLRSTNLRRTIGTVRSVAAGLYGKEDITEPLIIHTVNDKEEFFYPNSHCEVIRLLVHRDWIRFESPESQIIKHHQMLEDLLKIDKSLHKLNYVHIRDDLVSRMAHGLPVPDVLVPHLDQIHKYAVRLFLYQCTGFSSEDSDTMLRMIAGPMLRHIRDKMELHVNGSNSPKLFLYGAHDSSLVPLLVALGGFDYNWPPFVANLTFELYKLANSSGAKFYTSSPFTYFIKMSYCDKPFIIPGCTSEMCPYDLFWKSLSEYEVPSAALPTEECDDVVKHKTVTEEYRKQQMDEDESESEMPAGM